MSRWTSRWYRRLLWVLGLFVFIAAFGYWQWQRQLAAWGIDDWQISLAELRFTRLAFHSLQVWGQQGEQAYEFGAAGGEIDWRWQGWQPQLTRVNLASANLRLLPRSSEASTVLQDEASGEDLPPPQTEPGDGTVPDEAAQVPLPANWRLPEALPRLMHIEQLTLAWPCPRGECSLVSRVNALLAPEAARVQVTVPDAPDPIHLTADYAVHQAGTLPHLSLEMDAGTLGRLEGHLGLEGDLQTYWSADMQLALNRPSQAWLEYIDTWYPSLAWDDVENVDESLGLAIEGLTFTLKSTLTQEQSLSAAAFTEQPLALTLETRGKVRATLAADLRLGTDTLMADFTNLRLQLQADEWALGDLRIQGADVKAGLDAYWTPGQIRVAQAQPEALSLSVSAFQWASGSLDNLDVQLGALSLAGDPADWRQFVLETRGTLRIGNLNYQPLHPQSWHWQGELGAQDGQWLLKGDLTAGAQVSLAHTLKWHGDTLNLQAQMNDLFLLAGNPLQQMVPQWPPLLSLNRGRLGARARLDWTLPGLVPRGEVRVMLSEVAGVYDTTLFSGATGELRVQLKKDTFQLSSDTIKLQQLVRGFTLGPLQAGGNYTASVEQPTQGQLQLAHLDGGLLGGRVSLIPTRVDLARLPQSLTVELHEVDLARLLAEHPSTEITGTGRLSGRLPLSLGPEGITVAQGQVAALAPGGQLQYRSERATSMAAGNPGMKLITDALDDFHYSVLASEVTYDETGRLLLGVRLEGRNPAVEAGRPINFNINLEEDLPALIASLQLSSQLSDQIKKRVQDRLRQASRKKQPAS